MSLWDGPMTQYRSHVFTGIVRELGRIVSADAGRGGVELVVQAPEAAAALGVGDSVSIDG